MSAGAGGQSYNTIVELEGKRKRVHWGGNLSVNGFQAMLVQHFGVVKDSWGSSNDIRVSYEGSNGKGECSLQQFVQHRKMPSCSKIVVLPPRSVKSSVPNLLGPGRRTSQPQLSQQPGSQTKDSNRNSSQKLKPENIQTNTYQADIVSPSAAYMTPTHSAGIIKSIHTLTPSNVLSSSPASKLPPQPLIQALFERQFLPSNTNSRGFFTPAHSSHKKTNSMTPSIDLQALSGAAPLDTLVALPLTLPALLSHLPTHPPLAIINSAKPQRLLANILRLIPPTPAHLILYHRRVPPEEPESLEFHISPEVSLTLPCGDDLLHALHVICESTSRNNCSEYALRKLRIDREKIGQGDLVSREEFFSVLSKLFPSCENLQERLIGRVGVQVSVDMLNSLCVVIYTFQKKWTQNLCARYAKDCADTACTQNLAEKVYQLMEELLMTIPKDHNEGILSKLSSLASLMYPSKPMPFMIRPSYSTFGGGNREITNQLAALDRSDKKLAAPLPGISEFMSNELLVNQQPKVLDTLTPRSKESQDYKIDKSMPIRMHTLDAKTNSKQDKCKDGAVGGAFYKLKHIENFKRLNLVKEYDSRPGSEHFIRIPGGSDKKVKSKRNKDLNANSGIRSIYSPPKKKRSNTMNVDENLENDANAWKHGMDNIDDLKEPDSGSEIDEDEDDNNVEGDLQQLKLKPTNSQDNVSSPLHPFMLASSIEKLKSKKAQFMFRIYKGLFTGSLENVKAPPIDTAELVTLVQDPEKIAEAEELLKKAFQKFMKTIIEKPEAIKYLEENFDEEYTHFCENDPSISNVLDIITNLANVGFCNSDLGDNNSDAIGGVRPCPGTNKTQSSFQSSSLCKQIQNIPFSKFESTQIEELRNNPIHRPSKSKFQSIVLHPSIKIPKQTIVQTSRSLLKAKAMETINLNKTDPFFRDLDHFDAGNEFPTKTGNDSPAKSVRSSRTNRKRRSSTMSTILQRDLISMKNSKLMETKNFDSRLMKTVRPLYLFDPDMMKKIRLFTKYLILNEREKLLAVEIIYFKEEILFKAIDYYNMENDQTKLLHKTRQIIKSYKKGPLRRNLPIRFPFEDTMVYLNKVGVLKDKVTHQLTNLFKYNHEDVLGILELFIFNRDFEDFVENLLVLQQSRYLDQNQKGQKDLVQGEKTYKLVEGVQDYIEEYFNMYFSNEKKLLLTKMINEGNEELGKFLTQHEALTTKITHKFSSYAAFNMQLLSYLDKHLPAKHMKKITTRMEVFKETKQEPGDKEKYDKFIKTEQFKNCQLYNPLFTNCISQVYEVNKDLKEFIENFEVYMEINRELIKEYRLLLVLEGNNISAEDIDKILLINGEGEDLTKKDKAIKDALNLFFMLEDEKELIESLKMSKAFPSLHS